MPSNIYRNHSSPWIDVCSSRCLHYLSRWWRKGLTFFLYNKHCDWNCLQILRNSCIKGLCMLKIHVIPNIIFASRQHGEISPRIKVRDSQQFIILEQVWSSFLNLPVLHCSALMESLDRPHRIPFNSANYFKWRPSAHSLLGSHMDDHSRQSIIYRCVRCVKGALGDFYGLESATSDPSRAPWRIYRRLYGDTSLLNGHPPWFSY